MVKSWTNQKNVKVRARVEPFLLDLSIALPRNIDREVENEIFDVIKVTPFSKLCINATAYQSDIGDEVSKRAKPGATVNVGYVRKYDVATHKFNVIIFDKFIPVIKKFVDPAMEIIYLDGRDGLMHIKHFNIIDLTEKAQPKGKKSQKTDKPKDSSDPKPNAESLVPTEVAETTNQVVPETDVKEEAAEMNTKVLSAAEEEDLPMTAENTVEEVIEEDSPVPVLPAPVEYIDPKPKTPKLVNEGFAVPIGEIIQ